MDSILDKINSPEDLKKVPEAKLPDLAHEVRCFIRDTVSTTGGHLASNLGVVELTIALHYVFDFSHDRLVFDVGHQSYTHKILTGRRTRFATLRQMGGLAGFPTREESEFDPFTAGHAGTSISTALGLLLALERKHKHEGVEVSAVPHVVAVVGDASIGAGLSFEGLNHAGDTAANLLVVLNDNRMAISKTVGAHSNYLNRIRSSHRYNEIKREVRHFIDAVPVLGRRMERVIENLKDIVRHALVPGQFFEELGLRYFGPIDGHDFDALLATLREIKKLRLNQPILLHVMTNKGEGDDEACEDPCRFHGVSPRPKVDVKSSDAPPPAEGPAFTSVFAEVACELAAEHHDLVAITAAMPDGTGLIKFAERFGDRFYDVGICEQHAVAMAGGMAAAGLRPLAAIYSTFLQRAYDQVFHDVCLQNFPLIFALDRAGLVGGDGPTHHGVYDVAYLRHLPRIVLMAPVDADELRAMFRFAMTLSVPCAIRYPRAPAPSTRISSKRPIELGEADVLAEGRHGTLLVYGALAESALEAARVLSKEGIELAVVNARFAKPLDENTILDHVRSTPFVLTLEDGCEMGGFGSAVLEMVSSRGGDASRVHVAGIPDRFIEHGTREQLFAKLKLDAEGIVERVRDLLK